MAKELCLSDAENMLSSIVSLFLFVVSIFRPSSRFLTEPSGVRMAFTEHQYEVSLVWSSAQPQWDSTVFVRQTRCNEVDDISDWTEVEPQWTWNFITISHQWEVDYRVVLQDVYPECEYEYMIGSGLIWSPLRKFQSWTPFNLSSPSLDDFRHVASFLVVGDLGSGSTGDLTRSALFDFRANQRVDALLHLGDIAYNLDSEHPSMSRTYFEEMEPIASTLPYMVLAGNHENKDNFTQYARDFRMPVTPENGGSNLFYSFDMGRAHIVAFSTERIYDGPMKVRVRDLQWLENDLKRANWNRAAVPWVIVMMHRPLYCSAYLAEENNYNADCGERADELRDYMEDMLVSASVDLVLEAHVHNYQRFAPIYRNVTILSEYDDAHTHRNPRAPVYILEGSAGNREGNDQLSPAPMPWMIYQSRELGFGRLQILNESTIFWEHWDSASGERTDFVTIEKTQSRYSM